MQKPPLVVDFALKEISPNIGTGASTYDLVEQMQYLYVRVVKAKGLPGKDITGSCDPYIEVKLGNYRGTTKHFEKTSNPEWNQVFAFSKEKIQASILEVSVKNKVVVLDDLIGRVTLELNEIPKRAPPDSPLAPHWHILENRKGDKIMAGELMLAVWEGTQADEAFSDAWHSDAGAVGLDGIANIRSKVYISPRLWYVRVNVIEVQDLVPSDGSRFPEAFVKVILGNQELRTRISQIRGINLMWNEDLIFVAAEPFDEPLILSVEDRVGPNKDEVLGKCVIPLHLAQRRLDHRPVSSRWYNLEKHIADGDQNKVIKFASRLHLRVSMEGGYHVLEESTLYSSDLRPTAKQLWRPSIGILELGFLGATGLMAMKSKGGQGTTDAYCVAKYGQKWVRTRTVVGSFSPKWNEQYTWEVYDQCTVITIGVFDNGYVHGEAGGVGDIRIGKVRIRLSTLETDRVYTHSYPLLVVHSSGVKKMGEVQLALRFSCSSLINMLFKYSHPLLPKMHYIHPFTVNQFDNSRHQAMQIVSVRLSRAEPPLRKEVVEYMLDDSLHFWSMRRSKTNFFRIMVGLIAIGKRFDEICNWKNPFTTILVHIVFMSSVLYPELIPPAVFLCLSMIGIWNFYWRPRYPPWMDSQVSDANTVHIDELDEEFDTYPTSQPSDTVRMRYDRLRGWGGKILTVSEDLASQGERFQSLVSWRDPRATTIFMVFCLIAAVVLYYISFQFVAILTGIYVLRHPCLRSKLPLFPLYFFSRLPAKSDYMM